jgi:CheY-like chemotaxis protein
MVVDDDDVIRQLTRRMLEGRGYAVLTASDGPSALRATASAMVQPGQAVDLVLTDIDMPGGDGYALGRQLVMRWPAVRVIYMSGTTHGLVRRAGLGPLEHFIQKPFSAGDLLPKLELVLGLAAAVQPETIRRDGEEIL